MATGKYVTGNAIQVDAIISDLLEVVTNPKSVEMLLGLMADLATDEGNEDSKIEIMHVFAEMAQKASSPQRRQEILDFMATLESGVA